MKDFYPRLEANYNEDISDLFPGICKKIESDEKQILQLIFSGIMVLFRNKQYYAIDLSKAPSRPTSDSIAEPDNIMGSRDGFVENIKENINEIDVWNYLIQDKWVKSHNLMLCDIVDDILNVDNKEIDAYLKSKITDERSQYFEKNIEIL